MKNKILIIYESFIIILPLLLLLNFIYSIKCYGYLLKLDSNNMKTINSCLIENNINIDINKYDYFEYIEGFGDIDSIKLYSLSNFEKEEMRIIVSYETKTFFQKSGINITALNFVLFIISLITAVIVYDKTNNRKIEYEE